MINEILELEYVGEPLKRVVLFNCQWCDSRHLTGTRKRNHYKIIEINHTKIYERSYDPFISAQNARKYIIYLTLENANQIRGWWLRLKQGVDLKLKK